MSDDTYNGWTNHETWAVALHIDNDEGLYHYRSEMAAIVIERAKAGKDPSAIWSDRDAARFWMADRLKDWVETLAEQVYFPEHEPTKALLGMFNDIGSVWRVNWQEIADNWLSEYDDFRALSHERQKRA